MSIYKNFLENHFINNKKRLNEYSEYLAGDFLHNLKKTKVNELNFSTAVNLFILSHNNKNILPFLGICNNYNYIKDDINKDFSNLLNDYIKFSDGFLSVFIIHKKR